METTRFIRLTLCAGLTVLLFSCCDKNKNNNPPVIETPAAQFTVVLHDRQPVKFNDLSEGGGGTRTFSGRWSDASKAFEMWADYEKGRCKADADLYDVVPVTPSNEVWFTVESDDAKFTSVNARLNSDGAKLTSEGSGKGIIYRLSYQSDADPTITFWTGNIDNASNCVQATYKVLCRETIEITGIEARLTRMENGETGIYKAVKGGVNTLAAAEEGTYKMEGIWLKWLGSMYPAHGDYGLYATENPGGYYISDFKPTCVDPDYIERKIEVEILGTIPRYATPDIGLKYGYDETRNELSAARWKLNKNEKEGSAKDYYYAVWNYEKNPECTWFPRKPYTSYYDPKTGEAYDIDINPADLRGRRIQTWEYNLGGALYDYDPSKWITSNYCFKVCFHTSGEKPRGYWIAFESRFDSEGIQERRW